MSNYLNKFLTILDTVEPYEPPAVTLFRKSRQMGIMTLSLKGHNKRDMVQAIAEMKRTSDQSQTMLKRVMGLRPVQLSVEHDEDMFGC